MVIEYETDQYIKEYHKIEIADTKNVFFKGTNPYDGLDTYFGIWTNEDYLVIVTIISNRNISYEYSLSKGGYTEPNIKNYLKYSKNVQVISKDVFKQQLDKIKSIIEI